METIISKFLRSSLQTECPLSRSLNFRKRAGKSVESLTYRSSGKWRILFNLQGGRLQRKKQNNNKKIKNKSLFAVRNRGL